MDSLLDLDKLANPSKAVKYAALTSDEKYMIEVLTKPDTFSAIDPHHSYANKRGKTVFQWGIVSLASALPPSHLYIIFETTDLALFERKAQLATELVNELRRKRGN